MGLLEEHRLTPQPDRLRWYGPGQWIGGLDWAAGSARATTVQARRDSLVLEVERTACREMLSRKADGFAKFAAHILRNQNAGLQPRPDPFILGLSPHGITAEILERLRQAVESHADCAWVDGQGWRDGDPDALLDREADAQQTRLQIWLADPTETAWSQRVVLAADEVALLSPARPDAIRALAATGQPWTEQARRRSILAISDQGEDSAEDLALGAMETPVLVLRNDPTDLTDFLDQALEVYTNAARLGRFELFTGLETGRLSQIQESITWRTLPGGAELMATGDAADGLYVLDVGRLAVSARSPTGERKRLGEIRDGTTVGELGLLQEGGRTADVHAMRDSRIGFLPADTFQRLSSVIPRLGQNVARIAANRTRPDGSPGTEPPPSVIAVILLDPDPRGAAFLALLERAVRDSLGLRCTTITAATAEAEVGTDAAQVSAGQQSYHRLLSWLRRVETSSDVTVMWGTAAEPAWTQFCARQADRVLLVAPANSAAALRPIEHQLRQSLGTRGAPTDLVLLQPADITEASGTAAWLDPRPECFVHHLRDGTLGDAAALARRVMGCAHGLALSGGGSRATAHLGVVRAMQDLGLPLDMITGTSSGAGIAATLAGAGDLGAVLEAAIGVVLQLGVKLSELEPPLTAVTSGARFSKILHDGLGDRTIEDQLIPMSFSAVDIVRQEPVWITRGPLWQAVRASASLPIVYPPVSLDGRLLVDGALVIQNPADKLLPRCANGLLVISELYGEDNRLAQIPSYGTALSGWRQLRDRLLPGRQPKPAPGLNDVITRAMTLGNALVADPTLGAGEALCHIRTSVSAYGLLDVDEKAARHLEAMAYDEAIEPLQAWMDRKQTR